MRLTVLHTNDVHAEYDNWLRCAAFIKKRRIELGAEPCLYVDCGDHLDMSVDECGLSEGRLHLDLLGDAGLDAFVPGNNEFYRASRETLAGLSEAASFPWLLSTVGEAGGGSLSGFHQELMLERGLPIGLLGALAPMDGAAEELHGLVSLDLKSSLMKSARSLRENGAAIVILLSHCGFEEDKVLAGETGGCLDVIVGGHSHTELHEIVTVGSTTIVQAGGLGKFVGELELELGSAKPRVAGYRLHPLAELPGPDPGQASILEGHRAAARSFLGEEVCTLPQAMSREELLTLTAELLRSKFRADLGMSFGPAATAGLPAGPIRVGDIYGISRSFLTPASFEISGRQLESLIVENADESLAEAKGYGIGFRPQGLAFGRLVFSGLEWDWRDGRAHKVRVGGRDLDPAAWYRAGSLSHLYSAEGGGHPSLDGSRNLDPRRFRYLREYLLAWFRERGR